VCVAQRAKRVEKAGGDAPEQRDVRVENGRYTGTRCYINSSQST